MTGYELWISKTEPTLEDDIIKNVGGYSEYINTIPVESKWPWRGAFNNLDDMTYVLECLSGRHRNILFVMRLKDYGTCDQFMLRALNGRSELVHSYMVEFPEPSDEFLNGYTGDII